ncbi:DUF5103 domain-containing protein [Capnocytophaga catalasegens]|uniref:DUF5103 domain-containing protein n=1 Tax=Capnocytophaga catalasegens TaxID=1004260 RepID=A0AAV5AZ02_9FLAO|nr:DUF5103 domain-containing protein [Capnocytophaga catalasegens]GIZ14787.1 DUF5103 domain-containing protein [Capnocytophaga catalasegens]GJM51155.1 DUF5103 domain-containing protein [Capnocytophaga catalasegens]GJM53534.1 DUF5103 domain-containing protein [Capnocytophaga catalasegens]
MKKLFLYLNLIIAFMVIQNVFSQEKIEPDYIKSIIFRSLENDMQFPIVQLGESFRLSFDDLRAEENDYYYVITHCDYDWKPSQLIKSEYLSGMDDMRITNFTNSYATLQPYTHYELTLPNSDTGFLLTGNYILTITDTEQKPVFTRRFVVYSNTALVQMTIKQNRDLKFVEEKQVVQFKLSSKSLQFENPQINIKVAILQNFNWNNMITNVAPQYVLGNELVYKYDKETAFWGGNEYFYFENKDIRLATTGVYHVEQTNNMYHSVLYTAPYRRYKTYTYNPDIDGDFRILTTQGNPTIEAEYSQVYFSVEAYNQWLTDEVYVYGGFSENRLTDAYRLHYNSDKNIFEGKVYLKQGFYNYKFALKSKGKVDYNAFSGNHYQTENNYTILVYYRPTGALYDRVIGVGSLNSTQVTRQ